MLRLGVIGAGQRACSVISKMIAGEPEVVLAAVADPDPESVRYWLNDQHNPVPHGPALRFHQHADQLLKRADELDGVVIGTRCHLHSEMACKVAKTRLPLLLEKPVAITMQQVQRLAEVFAGCEDRVLVSFPLRATPLFDAVRRIIREGRLGPINQVQAFNNVPYGGTYFGYWYRNYDEAGGLWLQKATHDFDYINALLDRRPLMIAATSSQVVYGGNMPHDLRCSACDRADTCIESHLAAAARGFSGGMANYNRKPEGNFDHLCAFSRDIRNQDAGAALIMYDGGVHAAYSQNFVTRRDAARRGAIITGHHATLDFDWYTETVRVVEHQREHVEQTKVAATGGHAGGDEALCRQFVRMMRGEASGNDAGGGLRAGLVSVAMCLAARSSAYHHRFEPIVVPGDPLGYPPPPPATEVVVE